MNRCGKKKPPGNPLPGGFFFIKSAPVIVPDNRKPTTRRVDHTDERNKKALTVQRPFPGTTYGEEGRPTRDRVPPTPCKVVSMHESKTAIALL